MRTTFFQTSTLKHISVLGLLGTFDVILFLQKSLLSLLILMCPFVSSVLIVIDLKNNEFEWVY